MYCSLRANPLARSPGQVKLDSDKWKLWKNKYKIFLNLVLGQVVKKMKAKTVLSRHTSLCIWNPENKLCWFMMKIVIYVSRVVFFLSAHGFHSLYISTSTYKCIVIDLFIIFITFTSVILSSHKEFFPLVYILVDPKTNLKTTLLLYHTHYITEFQNVS